MDGRGMCVKFAVYIKSDLSFSATFREVAVNRQCYNTDTVDSGTIQFLTACMTCHSVIIFQI